MNRWVIDRDATHTGPPPAKPGNRAYLRTIDHGIHQNFRVGPNRMKRSPLPVVLIATLLLAPTSALVAQEGGSPQAPPLRDLTAVLDTGVVLHDRNGDGIVDDVTARILLPSDPTEVEATAAANVAARLAFETVSSDLGYIGAPSDPVEGVVIVIGGRALDQVGASPESAVNGLAPGQGAWIFLPASTRLPYGGVAIVGYDASGLLTAADYWAGRYPDVWALDEMSWTDATRPIREFLDARELSEATVSLTRVVVDANRAGAASARAEVGVDSEDALESILAALTADGEEVDTNVEAAAPDEPVAAAEAAESDADSLPELNSLEIRDVRRVDIRVVGPSSTRTVPLRPESARATPEGETFRPGADATFSLADLYSVGGIYRDTNRDLVADETAAYLSVSGGEAADLVADFASRIGLETAGIRFPLVTVAGRSDRPESFGFPILVGADHERTRELLDANLLSGIEGNPGEGFVRVVDGRFGDRNGMVVGGSDSAGVRATLDWVANRAPYLWSHGKGEYRLSDAETEVRRFFQVVEAPGQLALGLTKLGVWMDRTTDSPPTRVEVELAAEEMPSEVAAVAEEIVLERFPEADIDVSTWPTGFGVGDTIFSQRWEIPWEVDDVRTLLDSRVYPSLTPESPVRIEVRVSEPPDVRSQLAEEIRREVEARGVDDAEILVLSAYKQGYSWLNDAVLPRLRDLSVDSLEIRYHTLQESEEVRWQTVAAETRWLQELYPIDAVLARELAISDSAIVFRPTRSRDPIYEVIAYDAQGTVVYEDRFDPRYVVRPFFDLFPEYEQVRVTTGWLRATSGDEVWVDERVVTDPERFWDRLQTETYAEIVDYVMDIQDGRPSSGNAPYFDEFRIDLRLSEPNYRIGVDEEVISSLEALHEDLYFETLTLFDLIGSRYGTSLSFAGRILPYIDPTGAGRPGTARLTFTGKERGVPEIRVRSWTGESASPTVRRYSLGSIPVDAPTLSGVSIQAGDDGLSKLVARIQVPDSVDRFEEFEARSSEAGIDRQFMNVELLEGMIAALRRLHDAGAVQDALSWDRVRELVVDFRVEEDEDYRREVSLPRSMAPRSTVRPQLRADGWSWDGSTITQWDTPIPPEESDRILSRLNTFPEVNAYYVAESFLGQTVWAADVLPPHPGRFLSQAKLNALRPTLLLSGRQHANEVSSTSHILRLGERLVTDPEYRALLDKVNVVLHPITNPDGARLAVEMQETNPDFMLHAGYLGALGVDATSGERSDDPIYPESQARRILRETWLPDIYINMHGYPSHEWVQYFAGYSAWVRSRNGGQRSWWTPRGWFIPGLSITEDEENPEYGVAQTAILDSVAAAMTGASEIDEVSRRLYARYKKYGEQDRDGFTEYFHNGILVNLRLTGPESIGTGPFSTRVTYFSTTTEAPDETARGEWLDTVATMGLTHSSALLRYLATGTFEIEREFEAFDEVVTRSFFRVKPVMPRDSGDGG